MARASLQITRRQFLQASAFSAGGLVLSAQTMLANKLEQAGIPAPWFLQGEIKTTYNYCDMCPWRCGVVVQSQNGVIKKIDGNPKDPKSRGLLCARRQAGPSFVYDPDRLRSPMIRTGERGEGKFKEVTWEEALDYTAEKLTALKESYGQESLAVLGHTSGDFWFTDYFAQAFGTPNAAKPSSSLCTSPREEAAQLTFGMAIGNHEPVDWEFANCIILFGTHIGEDARNTMMQDFANARARGAKVIVVDPRFSSVATKADYWLPIKPGTDTALLLAWMHVIINEERYDKEYVAEWTVGFDQLKAHVQPFTPEWASEITDLSVEQIVETARLMADTLPRSVIVPGRHVTWYGNDSQRMRAIYMVNALLGSIGREGGLYLNKTPYIESYPHPPFTVQGSSGGCSAAPGEESDTLPLGPTGKARADGVREKFMRGPTAVQELIEPMITGDPYPLKGLIAYGINLFHTIPNVPRTQEALKNLDFFLAIDVLPMEYVAWADVVFPEATYLERHDELWTCGHKTPYIGLREPAIDPLYDTKPGWWMARELGMRLGLEQFFKWETAEDYLNARLLSIGSNVTKLHDEGGIIVQKGKAYIEDFKGASPFHTASEKIELYSETLALSGHDPMPVYEATDEVPDGYFRMLYGRHPVHTFAKTQNTPMLHELYPENEIWVNEDKATDAGLADGEYVWLENQDGARSGPIKVKATQRIRQDAVYLVHGFGHNAPGLTNAHGKGASDAALATRYKLDPIAGSAGMRVNFVRLVKEA
jgi:thiosulfate reductase / polysulfide reductase chain A